MSARKVMKRKSGRVARYRVWYHSDSGLCRAGWFSHDLSLTYPSRFKAQAAINAHVKARPYSYMRKDYSVRKVMVRRDAI